MACLQYVVCHTCLSFTCLNKGIEEASLMTADVAQSWLYTGNIVEIYAHYIYVLEPVIISLISSVMLTYIHQS